MLNTEMGLLDFLKALFKSLNTPILIFAVGVIVIVAVLGANVPPTFSYLVYAVAIGAMVVHLATIIIPLLKTEKVVLPEPGKTTTEELKSGAILYVNVQGFSLLSYQEQELVVQTLRNELERFFDFETRGLSKEAGQYWLDFLGADFILFAAADSRLRQPQYEPLALCLAFGIHLQLLIKEMPFALSMTLNWGDDMSVIDIRGSLSLCGHALHTARRMIAFTEGPHFLISREAFDKLEHNLFHNGMAGSCQSLMDLAIQCLDVTEDMRPLGHVRQVEPTDEYYLKPLTLYDHHKREQTLFNFFILDRGGTVRVGNPSPPPDRVTVEHHEMEQSMDGVDARLVDRLIQAEEVTLIGITHHRLAEALQRAFDVRGSFWQKIEVVFADESNVQKLVEEGRTDSERLAQWEFAKRDIQVFFESKDPKYVGQWKCLECTQNVTLIGARCVSGNKASIRFAPVLAAGDPSGPHYFEIPRGSSAFEQLSRTFDIMVASSRSICEWDLFGRIDSDDVFRYHGIINRAKIPLEQQRLRGFCSPIMLIMLYVDTIGGLKSVLQERTVYNATTDTGTISNIAGPLCVRDVDGVEGGHLRINFDTANYLATRAFNRFSGWSPGQPLPEYVWKRAATRTLKEELGLDTARDQLVEQASQYLRRDHARNLYFKIFSLQLRRDFHLDELALVQQRRPYASLKTYTLREIKTLYERRQLNRLFQRHFKDVFVPTFGDWAITDN